MVNSIKELPYKVTLRNYEKDKCKLADMEYQGCTGGTEQ